MHGVMGGLPLVSSFSSMKHTPIRRSDSNRFPSLPSFPAQQCLAAIEITFIPKTPHSLQLPVTPRLPNHPLSFCCCCCGRRRRPVKHRPAPHLHLLHPSRLARRLPRPHRPAQHRHLLHRSRLPYDWWLVGGRVKLLTTPLYLTAAAAAAAVAAAVAKFNTALPSSTQPVTITYTALLSLLPPTPPSSYG
ncbi:hypothetical protein Agub_g15977 [Astrephomene gubernaculifera]|uniref:Uncharacterized protein n=1 Tax=Astrephomene gubernaculifera TaxID=47775 RepID=A0AAD3E3V6_9CHLO|nr:hypothetical protein Agub_g15977 [Astrephomene gubernaculifera]